MFTGTAIFDFDKTLIHDGSLLRILTALTGTRHVITAAISTYFATKGDHTISRYDSERLRQGLLRHLLTGKNTQEIVNAAERVYPSLRWNETLLERYHWHRDQGHRIAIATGGLALYMEPLLRLRGLSPDALLATELTQHNGILTGEMVGPACVGHEKARQVRNWMGGVREECWAYGNLPKDGPMLALADHPYSVKHGHMRPAPQQHE